MIRFKIFLSISLLTMIFQTGHMQTTCGEKTNVYQIHGAIWDINMQPVEMGNVILICPQDSKMVRGEVFLDGSFLLTKITVDSVLIKISALGFEPHQAMISKLDTTDVLDLGLIILQPLMNVGVEVVASQTFFENRGSDLIVHVEHTALSNAGTALDVIRNSPKVVFGRNGAISIMGPLCAFCGFFGFPLRQS